MKKVLWYNPWKEDAEPGDIMVSRDGKAFRLCQSNGRNKRALGELTPREIKKPGKKATIDNGKLKWIVA